MKPRRSPNFAGLVPSSIHSSVAARGSSRKSDTSPELMLRRSLHKYGYRYRKTRRDLPGIPDIVFVGPRIVVFVDGDFWHGKDWESRRRRLLLGHNPDYWCAKIQRNIHRDQEITAKLTSMGWMVYRFWESDVKKNVDSAVAQIGRSVAERRPISHTLKAT